MKKSFLATSVLSIATMITTSALASEQGNQSRIEELKSQIVTIATENQNNLENFAEVRAELDGLVAELTALKMISPEESLSKKVGAWRQLWTDDSDDTRANNLFVTVDREQTFQVVYGNGTFYNVSVVKFPLGLQFTAFLKGSYQQEGSVLGLEFTSLKLRLGGISNVAATVQKADDQRLIGLVPFPGGAKKPNGPVGVRGEIKTVYIDDDVRIDYGQNLDDGIQDLFVLVRMAD